MRESRIVCESWPNPQAVASVRQIRHPRTPTRVGADTAEPLWQRLDLLPSADLGAYRRKFASDAIGGESINRRNSGGYGVAAGQRRRSAPGAQDRGQLAHRLRGRFEVAAQVLGLAVSGFRHEFEQARAGFAEVGQARVPEFVQIPAGSGSVGGGGGVEQVTGLVAG